MDRMGSSISSPKHCYLKKRRRHKSGIHSDNFNGQAIKDSQFETEQANEMTDSVDLKESCEIENIEKSQPEFPLTQRQLVVETWVLVEEHIAQVSNYRILYIIFHTTSDH